MNATNQIPTILPVILAGGSGTRLWPLSRALYPKQLIRLVDRHTMLQNTILRLNGLAETENPVVICNDEYRFMVAEQLRQINVQAGSIILEPVLATFMNMPAPSNWIKKPPTIRTISSNPSNLRIVAPLMLLTLFKNSIDVG